MTFKERLLYHQDHPAKLSTDIGVSFVSTYFLWQHQFLIAMLASFGPAMLASALVIRFAKLEWLQQSTFGRYIARFMNRAVEACRMAGQVVAWVGAWYHWVWLIPTGYGIVIAAWMSGMLHKRNAIAEAKENERG